MARLTRPDAVLFDFGGTLFDDTFDVLAGQRRMIELADGEPDPAEYARVAEELAADIHHRRLESQLEHSGASLTRVVGDCLGVSFPYTDAELDLEFWKASDVCTPVPGAHEVLEMLSDQGVPMGMVSNLTFGKGVLEYELDRAGWRHYFQAVISSNDYGIRKPHKALFLGIAGRMGVDPHECWYIGNWAPVDVLGAQRAGMTGIWLNRHGETCPAEVSPDAEITCWEQFVELWDEAV